MISQPSSARLIDAVRQALRENIAPVVSDPTALNLLGMIDSLLDNAARRCGHEIAWMREEIAAIEAVADRVCAGAAGADGRVAAALAELRAHRAASEHIDAVAPEYNCAGEVLSRCLESEFGDDDALRSAIAAVLDARLAREAALRGNFALVGRE